MLDHPKPRGVGGIIRHIDIDNIRDMVSPWIPMPRCDIVFVFDVFVQSLLEFISTPIGLVAVATAAALSKRRSRAPAVTALDRLL
jgi:hypothetical protein